MPAVLKLLAIGGIALVLAGVLALLWKDARAATATVGMVESRPLTMAWPLLLVAVGLLLTGWTYLLTGALRATRWLTFGVLILATVAQSGVALSAGNAALGVLALLGIWVYVLLRALAFRAAPLLVDVLVIGASTLALHGMPLLMLLASIARAGGGAPLPLQTYPVAVGQQMVLLLVLLIPMLVLTGIDLAEMAARGGAWAGTSLASLLPVPLAAGAAVAVALATTLVQLRSGVSVRAALLAALVALAGGVALLRRPRPGGGPAAGLPPFALLFLLSYSLFVVQIAAIALAGLVPGGLGLGVALGRIPNEAVWAGAAAAAAGAGGYASLRARLSWRRTPAWAAFIVLWGAWIWLTVGNPVPLIAAFTGTLAPGSVAALLSMPTVEAGVAIAVAIVVLGLLAAGLATRTAVGFAASIAIGMNLLGAVDGLYTANLSLANVAAVAQVGLLLALPVLFCAQAMRSPASGPRLRTVALAGLVLLATAWLGAAVYAGAAAAGLLPPGLALPGSTATVVLLALALVWDFLISGGRFTNGASRRFPREGRVLLYLGYLSLAASALVWSNGVRGAAEAVFDEAVLPEFGLVVIGLPLVFWLWATLWRERRA